MAEQTKSATNNQQASSASPHALDDAVVVLKFGGTSVSKRHRWDNIRKIADALRSKGHRVLIVVSALSGVTDMLKSLSASFLDVELMTQKLAELKARHIAMAEELGVSCNVIAPQLDALQALVGDHRRTIGALSWQAEILAMGEQLSSALGASYLSASGLTTTWLDARDYLLSIAAPNDSDWARYLSANCECSPSPAIQAQLKTLAPVLLTQGFMARNLAGETVILGRGGSDTSAAYFASLLQAKELQIWTDVPGMFSANPKAVPEARLLQRLDYDEAQEIATTGAKVLHPRCLAPVREAGVPLLIKDTERPDMAGTYIGPMNPGTSADQPSVKAVSMRTGLTLVSMESLGMWQQVGFMADIFTAFKTHGLSVDLIGSSETNVTVSLDPSENLINADTLAELCTDLAKVCRVKVIAPCAAVTLVGRGMRSLLQKLSGIWAEVGAGRVHLLTQSSNDLNLTFVVDEERAEALLPAVHANLLRTGAMALDDSAVIGPAWKSLQQRVPATEAWWQIERAALLTMAEAGPTYVYHRKTLAQRLQELQAMQAIDQWFYASKANSHPEVLRVISAKGFGLECVSLEEILHVQAQVPNHPASHILYSPNFAPRAEYEKALKLGVQITLDNLHVLQYWGDLLRGQRVHLRLDLGYGGGHHAKVNTGGDRSKFGLSRADLPVFRALAKAHDVTIVGLHTHLGSGIRDAKHWPNVFAELALIAEQMPSVGTLNLGGGLGVPSRPDDDRLDLVALNARLLELKVLYPQFQIRMEPGRYPVAECGVLLTRVTQTKSKGKGIYVGVDTGMNSLIRPALYDAFHEIVNLTRLDEPKHPQLATIVGPICETGDVLGHARSLPTCQEGDVILIAEAGAYGRVMSSNYNLREPAKEVML